ncbi:MAG: nucleotidyltransferase family protein [Armatimonadota bacterium]|jgi:mannose-1-phosphate guanylyltransferase
MKAVILCAGHGTRLRPLTNYISKAMVPVAGMPILERIVRRLVDQGFEEQIIALSVFHEQVIHYFGDGSRFGARIEYSINTEPTGTAGEIAQMRPLLEGETDVLVHYGDILSDLDARAMADEHLAHRPALTIGLVTGVEIHAGVADVDAAGRVTRFEEKPPLQIPTNAAIFVLGEEALRRCAPGRDFSYDIFPALIADGESVRGFIDEEAYWLDVGRLSDLDKANEFFGGSSDEH